MKPLEIQEAAHPARYLVSGDNTLQDSLTKVDYVLYLTSPTMKKETQHLVGLFGFWRQYTFDT